MKITFFIADVHLDTRHPERKDLIISFLKMVCAEKADLYILGDFFDYWANNRAVLRDNREVLQLMKDAAAQDSLVCMLIGNRDLLLSHKALAPFGIKFLGEEAEVTIDGKKIYLTHGHSLCTRDARFQRYKKIAWPVYRLLDAILPGAIENYLAGKFILKSKQVIYAQDQSRFQFSEEAINAYFMNGMDAVICGHAHKTVIHKWGEKCFYALPAWDQGKGGYLLLQNGIFRFNEFPG
ncbi:MAG: metallophosphoesterase [Proteobacteria bacterium]|nr:metallophosphoesterase [Pseudomonadota bacterium]